MATTNNNFSQDDPTSRMGRLDFLQNRIDAVAVELGVAGDLLLWAQTSYDQWEEIYLNADIMKAKTGVAFGAFADKMAECIGFYQKLKNLLKSVVKGYDNAGEIIRAYSIDGNTPRTREGIESAVDDLLQQHEIYKAAGDAWIIPDHFIDELRGLRIQMGELHSAARTQRERAKVARDAAAARFREDTLRMKLIYDLGVLAWGVQGTGFITLGMLPKSMVWTKHVPPSPENFVFDAGSRVFAWDPIDGADKYEVDYRKATQSGHWTAFYEGEESSCGAPDVLIGAYDFRVRAIAGAREGHWSAAVAVDFG